MASSPFGNEVYDSSGYLSVIPAQAGIQCLLWALSLDSRLRGNDGGGHV
ncbi:hypothetical protein [Ottowia sp. VDI28]